MSRVHAEATGRHQQRPRFWRRAVGGVSVGLGKSGAGWGAQAIKAVLVAVLAGGAIAQAALPSSVVRAQAEALPFAASQGYFLVLTDLHVGSGRGDEATAKIVDEVLTSGLTPDFVLLTGDVTELNRSQEWQAAQTLLRPLAAKYPVYTLPGNHDANWPNDSQAAAAATLHPGRAAVDWRGIEVIGLDSSLDLQQYGHIGPEQRQWLLARLTEVAQRPDGSRTVILAAHHPLGWSDAFIGDQDQTLAEVAAAEQRLGISVPLILSGHGHAFRRQFPDGRVDQMIGAALDGKYAVVARRGQELIVYGKQVGSAWQAGAPIPLKRPLRPAVAVLFPQPAGAWTAPTPIPVRVQVTTPAGQKGSGVGQLELSWRVDQLGWQPFASVEPDPVPGDAIVASADLGTKAELSDGVHTLQVRVRRGDQEFITQAQFQTAQRGNALLWRVPVDGRVQSQPVLDDQAVYVSVVAAAAGRVVAVDRLTGRLLREYRTPTGAEVVASPALDESQQRVIAGSKDGYVYAWDKATGQLVWSYPTGAAIYGVPLVVPAPAEPGAMASGVGQGGGFNVVYIASSDGGLYALRTDTGKLLWRAQLDGTAEGSPLLLGDELWIGSWDGSIHRIDRRTGALTAKIVNGRTYFTSGQCTAVEYNGTVVFTNTDSKVYGYRVADGQLQWQVAKASGYGSPALDAEHGRVILSTLAGEVYALDVASGQVAWSTKLAAPAAGIGGEAIFDSSPVLWQTPWQTTEALVATLGGRLWRLDTASGAVIGYVQLGQGFFFGRVRPVDGEDLVYAAGTDGTVYAWQPAPAKGADPWTKGESSVTPATVNPTPSAPLAAWAGPGDSPAEGLHWVEVGDGPAVPVAAAAAGAADSGRPATERTGLQFKGHYMYFALDDAVRQKLAAGAAVEVSVQYQTPTPATLAIEYDSIDALNGAVEGAYSPSASVPLLAGNETSWQTARFILRAVKFAHRQNGGSDFRLNIYRDLPVVIGRVEVRALATDA